MLAISTLRCRMAKADFSGNNGYTLDSVREALVRQEDTIIFALIERAKFPINAHAYNENYSKIPDFCGSLVDFVVKNTEAVQAKVTNCYQPYLIVLNCGCDEAIVADVVRNYGLMQAAATEAF